MQQGFLLVMSTIIALCAVMAGLGFIFNILLGPVKETQAALKTEVRELQKGQVRLEKGQALLKTELQKDFQNLESKLNLLLKDKK